MINKKAILLLSGGIDSTTLLAKLSRENYEIIAVSFDYGQRHKIEINYAQENAKKYNVKHHFIIKLDKALFTSSALVNPNIEIETYENAELPQGQEKTYVPFRNLLFVSTALSLAESMMISEIFLAINNDDRTNFWDCRRNFIEKLNSIASLNTSIQIKTPFLEMSKTDVVKIAQKLNVNLDNTITCYQPNKTIECGVCLSCVTKQKAINNV